jgi:hypothetical protein
MKHRILGAALAALFSTSALAQVNFVPQMGITSGYAAKTTYSSAFFGLVPAASATDLVCIAGSAAKVIRVNRIVIGGSGTAVSLPIQVVRRATADTAGTPAATTANPGITTQIASMDTGQSANTSATATLISYTANPTINDTAPVYLASAMLGIVATTVGAFTPMTIFDFAKDIENNVQVPTLRGAAQQICVNLGAASPTAALNGFITWSEE